MDGNFFDKARAAGSITTAKSTKGKVTVKCKNKACRKEFQARAADVKRGWGKFCSKACKAVEQEKRTGQYRHYMQGQNSAEGSNIWEDDDYRYARRWYDNGRSAVSQQDKLTGEVEQVEFFDRNGVLEGCQFAPTGWDDMKY